MLLQMLDAIGEARENVKFLGTLDKALTPLYSGTPKDIKDALPALFSSLHMLQAASKCAFALPWWQWAAFRGEDKGNATAAALSAPCTFRGRCASAPVSCLRQACAAHGGWAAPVLSTRPVHTGWCRNCIR